MSITVFPRLTLCSFDKFQQGCYTQEVKMFTHLEEKSLDSGRQREQASLLMEACRVPAARRGSRLAVQLVPASFHDLGLRPESDAKCVRPP